MPLVLDTMSEPTTAAPPPMPRSDEALMESFQERRAGSDFEELAGRYQDFAYRVAVALCGNPALAEEAAQEAFLRLARRGARFHDRGPGSFRAWFYQFVANITRNYTLSERRTRMRTSSPRDPHAAAEVDAASEAGEIQKRAVALRQALCGLAEDLRLPVVLHYLEGLSQTEIGPLLGVSQAQVSRRITQGLEQLRRKLAESGVALSGVALPQVLQSGGVLDAPAGLREALARMPSGGFAAAGRELSRRAAPPAVFTPGAALAAIALAAAAAGGAWWWSGRPAPEPPAAPAPTAAGNTPAPIAPADPLPAAPVNAQAVGPVNAEWTFEQGPPAGFDVLHGKMEWSAARDAMKAHLFFTTETFFRLPVTIGRGPYVIEIRAGWIKEGSSSCQAFWMQDRIGKAHKHWVHRHSNSHSDFFTHRDTITFYLLDRHVVGLFNGLPYLVDEWPAAEPGNRACLIARNRRIERVSIRDVKLDEIPQAARDPRALIAQWGPASREVPEYEFPAAGDGKPDNP